MNAVKIRGIALFLFFVLLLSFTLTACKNSDRPDDPEKQREEGGEKDPVTPEEPQGPEEPTVPDPPPEPVHQHTFNSAWSFDENGHWQFATCEHTTEKNGPFAHEYNENDICTICGFDKSPEEPPVSVSLTFDPQNGEEPFSIVIMSNASPIITKEVRKAGYSLLGWCLPDGETMLDFSAPVGRENLTLTAKWTEAFTYEEDENGITLTGYVGKESDVLLPHELYGKTVVSFGTIFAGKQITSIDIGEGYTEVCDSAFEGCTLLKTVILPSTMTKLGKSAFSGCEVIRKFVIPKGVKIIGSQCFAGCKIILIYANVSNKQNGWAYDWNPLDRQVNYDVSDNLLPIHYF